MTFLARHALLRLAAALLLGMAALCACDADNGRIDRSESAPGVNATTVLVGTSLPLTGHAGYLGTEFLRGSMVYINHANRSGGIWGRDIEVVAYDDAYDPPRCLANTQRLIVNDKVFALFDYVGTPTTVQILPMIEEARIPLLGMFTGANALREPFNRYVVNVRASYYQETGAAVRNLVEELGLGRIAVFYQYDAFGFDGLTGVELALKEYGLKPVARGWYNRGDLAVADDVHRIAASRAQAVIMIGAYAPCAAFIRSCARLEFNPVFYAVSFTGADKLARLLGPDTGQVVLMSQVVPPPGDSGAEGTDAARRYVELLRRDHPAQTPNFVGLEGFINARVLAEGLTRAGPNLTREGFIDAVESIKGYSVGAGTTITFGTDDHQGMDAVFFTRLNKGRFDLMRDWEALKADIARPANATHGRTEGEP